MIFRGVVLFLAISLACEFSALGEDARSPQVSAKASNWTDDSRISLDEDIKQLKARLDGSLNNEERASKILDIAEKVLANAEQAMTTSQAEIRTIETAWIIGGSAVGIVIAIGGSLLGFFGFKEYRQVKSNLSAQQKTLSTHIDEALIIMKAFRSSFELLRASFLAYDSCSKAVDNLTTCLDQSIPPDKRKVAQQAAVTHTITALDLLEVMLPIKQNEKQKEEMAQLIELKGDPPILGWAYQIYGFAKGNMATLLGSQGTEDYKLALSYIENGLRLWPGSSSGWFNAACFACLASDKQKALTYLRESIKIMPSFARDASKEPDLKSLWQDAEFKAITHQEL